MESNENLFPNHVFFFLEYLKSVPKYFNQYNYYLTFFPQMYLYVVGF